MKPPPKHPHAAFTSGSVSVSPEPLAVGVAFDVHVTTDGSGWLHVVTPCVDGWVSLGAGTSTIPQAAPCAAGTVTIQLTDLDGMRFAGPFTYTVT